MDDTSRSLAARECDFEMSSSLQILGRNTRGIRNPSDQEASVNEILLLGDDGLKMVNETSLCFLGIFRDLEG